MLRTYVWRGCGILGGLHRMTTFFREQLLRSTQKTILTDLMNLMQWSVLSTVVVVGRLSGLLTFAGLGAVVGNRRKVQQVGSTN